MDYRIKVSRGFSIYVTCFSFLLQVQEWFSRAKKMDEMTEAVDRLFQHLSSCNNRELLYDLYAYLWDIRGVISLLNSYVKWLGKLLAQRRNMTRESITFTFY